MAKSKTCNKIGFLLKSLRRVVAWMGWNETLRIKKSLAITKMCIGNASVKQTYNPYKLKQITIWRELLEKVNFIFSCKT